MSETLCAYPWVHLKHMLGDKVLPCCNYSGSAQNMTSTFLAEEINGEQISHLRQQMLSGERPAGCQPCFEREDAGSTSLRLEANREFGPAWLQEPKLRSLEFNMGNLCNLKCRSCDSTHSTKWAAEENQPRVQTSIALLENSYAGLTHFKFFGGEPLLMSEHEEILRRWSEQKPLSEVQLQYSTNGTVKASPFVLDIWRQVQQVQLVFSIDGMKASNDSFREGSHWEQIIANIKWYREQLTEARVVWGIHSVVSTHNIGELYELDEWLSDEFPEFYFSKDILLEPVSLSIAHLPEDRKSELISYLERLGRMGGISQARQGDYKYIAEYLRAN